MYQRLCKLTSISSLLFILLTSNIFAAYTPKDKMLADLDFLANTLDSVYAPKDLKNKQIGWDIQTELNNAKNKVITSDKINLKDYQVIVKDFLKSTQDYHVNYMFYRTKSAYLPFTIKGAEGRFFIVDIDYDSDMAQDFKFKVGDEVIEFDGKPISEAVENMIKQTSASHNNTDKELAELLLTQRSAAMLVNIPEGNIVIKTKDNNSIITSELKWLETPELIEDNYKSARNAFSVKYAQNIEKTAKQLKVEKIKKELINKFSILNRKLEAHDGIKKLNMNKFSVGNSESFFPELGEKVWEYFHYDGLQAYIFKNKDGKKVGFIRISDYTSVDPYYSLPKILEKFNEETSAVVIDQTNNPGGSIVELYDVLSLLTNKPLKTPLHQMTLTQQDVAEANEILEFIDWVYEEDEADNDDSDNSYEEDYDDEYLFAGVPHDELFKSLRNYAKFIISEWSQGKSLTSGYPLLGIKEIKPSKLSYTKPIVILTNSMDFSCADFLPAIIQDNNVENIHLVGKTTAGAGGFVKVAMYPNSLGLLGFSYTGSVATRLNNQPIEGLGVTPELNIDITANDLQNNFVDYIGKINGLVNDKIAEYEKAHPQDNNNTEKTETKDSQK